MTAKEKSRSTGMQPTGGKGAMMVGAKKPMMTTMWIARVKSSIDLIDFH